MRPLETPAAWAMRAREAFRYPSLASTLLVVRAALAVNRPA